MKFVLFKLLAFLLIVTMFISLVTTRCLDEIEGVPKRSFVYKSQKLAITIAASNRVSHALSSTIVQILLSEALGYQDVRVQHSSDNTVNIAHALQELTGCTNHRCEGVSGTAIPNATVNLEVWVPCRYRTKHWTASQRLNDAGPLGPSGRFGWFVSSKIVEEKWNKSNLIIDHWRALQMDQIRSMFSLNKHGLIKDFLTLESPGSDKHFCESPDCLNGVRESNHCTKQSQCAWLLSSFPDLDKGKIKKQISHLQLAVNVVWIGKHLPEYVRQYSLNNLSHPPMFYNWIPNTMTAFGNYTQIKFPSSSDSSSPGLGKCEDCDFEQHQLNKMTWSALASGAPEASQVISNVYFTQSQYEDLLRSYVHTSRKLGVNAADIENVACQWLKNNTSVWRQWIPNSAKKRRKIYLGGMFPKTGPYMREPGIIPSAILAQEIINKNKTVLRDFDLEILVEDTKCLVEEGILKFINYLENKTHPVAGILGPACSESVKLVAGVSQHYNMVTISYFADGLESSNREAFPYFFRISPQISQNTEVYLELMKKYKWKRVALISQKYLVDEYQKYHESLASTFEENGIEVVNSVTLRDSDDDEQIKKYLKAIKEKNAHIIIADFYQILGQKILCEAYKQSMTIANGYQWFIPSSRFTKGWLHGDAVSFACQKEEMRKAINGHISLSSSFFAEKDFQIEGNMTVAEWKKHYIYKSMKMGYRPSHWATYAYDAVWVYALSLNQLLNEDPSALETLHTNETNRYADGSPYLQEENIFA